MRYFSDWVIKERLINIILHSLPKYGTLELVSYDPIILGVVESYAGDIRYL